MARSSSLRPALSCLLVLLLSNQMVQSKNATDKCLANVTCKDGLLLPVWRPVNASGGELAGRAIIYFLCLCYIFLGISIISDRFMAAIEVITSQEKEVSITKPSGEVMVTKVRIWNETVSNLTLMALGSSAPEILLSIIEVIGHNFYAGDLGPGTIVGSAAYNMFVIIAICVWVIPEDQVRKIKHLHVYFFTASWSIFAYIWLFIILSIITPGVVEIWEALVTFGCFPFGVVMAWIADRRLLTCPPTIRYRLDRRAGVIVAAEGEDIVVSDAQLAIEAEERNHEEAIRILKELKDKYPNKNLDELREPASYNILLTQPKTRAFYRVQALRRIFGSGNVLKKHASEIARQPCPGLEEEAGEGDADSGAAEPEDLATCSYISFQTASITCLENCGSVSVPVVCRGGTGTYTFCVDYRTEEGTAQAASDYEHCEGTLVFNPGEKRKDIKVVIIDDDVFEEEEHFLVRLTELRVLDATGATVEMPEDQPPVGRLAEQSVVKVTILDDDHAGIFTFGETTTQVSEEAGTLKVTVQRNSGARGIVRLPFRTEPGSASGGGVDYQDAVGEIEFTNNQTSQTIEIQIINRNMYQRQDNFFLILDEPIWMRKETYKPREEYFLSAAEIEARRIAELGRPSLGQHIKMEVVISESLQFKSTVDELAKSNISKALGTHTWRQQFLDALTVSSGDDEEEGGEKRDPSIYDYVMHGFTVFWKVLFACVPPTDYFYGWACFLVSIMVIGILTALIGDLASHFGCTVGLKDSVTAVVFVALGTSLPDTFASKVSAIQDAYADASIGNVTGSNAVNVFLGLGLAWLLASIYWTAQGGQFTMDPGSLAFSVTLFIILAFVCMAVLLVRRRDFIGGELGGTRTPRLITTLLFLFLWFIYILFAGLEAYCNIEGF